jgi:hypothetical protein
MPPHPERLRAESSGRDSGNRDVRGDGLKISRFTLVYTVTYIRAALRGPTQEDKEMGRRKYHWAYAIFEDDNYARAWKCPDYLTARDISDSYKLSSARRIGYTTRRMSEREFIAAMAGNGGGTVIRDAADFGKPQHLHVTETTTITV